MEQNKFRCHFSIVIENLGSVFWVILFGFLTQADSAEVIADIPNAKEGLIFAAIMLGALAIIFVVQCIIWSKTWICIENEAIVIERRFLNRTVNTIGMKNISNINTEQNLFERLMGTYKIKLDTNSATTANTTDVKIVLSKNMAEQFKQQIMLRMNEELEEVNATAEEYDVSYKAKDIVMHCVYTASPISVIILLSMIIGFVVAMRFVNTGTVLLDNIINVLGSVIAIVIFVGSVFQSLVKDFFVYYGFKARRHENKIYLTHGFFKKRQYTLAVDKINAVETVSTVVSRILKRQYVKVICIGVGDEENENSMLLLSETKESLQQKLAILLPEFALEQPSITKREKQSIWSEVLGGVILIGIAIAIAVAFGVMDVLDTETLWIRSLAIVGAVLVVVSYLITLYLNFRTCGIGLGQNVLLLEEGAFQKVSTWIPYSKIQELEYTQGPICRHFGLAKGNVYILASLLNSIHSTSYYKLEVFDAIREKMLKRKAKQ